MLLTARPQKFRRGIASVYEAKGSQISANCTRVPSSLSGHIILYQLLAATLSGTVLSSVHLIGEARRSVPEGTHLCSNQLKQQCYRT